MKKTIILLTIVGLNALSASAITAEKATTDNRVINILIKHDLLVEREVPQARKARKSRVVRMGRNSRGVRPERIVRIAYQTPKKKNTHLSATSLIQKSYLSKLSK